MYNLSGYLAEKRGIRENELLERRSKTGGGRKEKKNVGRVANGARK